MMKHFNKNLIVVLLAFASLSLYPTHILAQIDSTRVLTKALKEGLRMVHSIEKQDYQTYINLTHPAAINMAGGAENLETMLQKGFGPNKRMVSIDLKLPPTLWIKDGLYQCAIPQKQVMEVNGQQFSIRGTLVGLSDDKGRSWCFMAATQSSTRILQEHIPELHDSLEVKPQTRTMLSKE